MTLDRREVVALDISAPPATVWQHVRQPDLVRRWNRSDSPTLDDEVRAFVAATEGRGDGTSHTLRGTTTTS